MNYMIERKYMSRTTPTILCNLCMVEDLENGKVVLQYRSPEKILYHQVGAMEVAYILAVFPLSNFLNCLPLR